MRTRPALITAAALPLLACGAGGCARSQYTGSWASNPASDVGDFRLGGMTLARDGTYTAFADYQAETRGFSGFWAIEAGEAGDVLIFESPRPGTPPVRYPVRFGDDEGLLLVTDPQSGITTPLVQIEPD